MRKVMLGLVMVMMLTMVGCGNNNNNNNNNESEVSTEVNTEIITIAPDTEKVFSNRVVLIENYEIVKNSQGFEGQIFEAPAVIKRVVSKDVTVDKCGLLSVEVDLTSVNKGHTIFKFKLTELPENMPMEVGTQFRAIVGLEPDGSSLIEMIFE